MSTKRGRVITAGTAGALILATGISTAAATLSSSTAAAGTTDAYLTSVSANAAALQAGHPAGGSSSQQALILSKTRAMQAEHQQEVAVEKAAAAKAAHAKAEARAAKAAHARAVAKADAAKAAKARAAANAAVRTQAVTMSGSPKQIAQQMLSQHGWGGQFSCLNSLWAHESGWSVTAENSSSGAYGIPQALPGSQMATAGGDWRTNAATQIKWGLTYIQDRYGSPCGAWAHEQSAGWY